MYGLPHTACMTNPTLQHAFNNRCSRMHPLQGLTSSSWLFMHVLLQVLALLCASAGVVVALLAFGWKDEPSQPLYSPHKWFGIAVMGAALLQLLVAPLKPSLDSPRRGAWQGVHTWWGRLTTAAGVANVFLGVVLLHDFKVRALVGCVLCAWAVMHTTVEMMESCVGGSSRDHLPKGCVVGMEPTKWSI